MLNLRRWTCQTLVDRALTELEVSSPQQLANMTDDINQLQGMLPDWPPDCIARVYNYCERHADDLATVQARGFPVQKARK
eukprot:3112459-Karenia_brevis.AAC.1